MCYVCCVAVTVNNLTPAFGLSGVIGPLSALCFADIQTTAVHSLHLVRSSPLKKHIIVRTTTVAIMMMIVLLIINHTNSDWRPAAYGETEI